ncbi:MAG: metallophosphoesterase family protein, partial [Planctomycetota bacterium]
MPTAIISDIHGNADALKAVLADIDSKGVDRVICLGDIIGYGPEPL